MREKPVYIKVEQILDNVVFGGDCPGAVILSWFGGIRGCHKETLWDPRGSEI